MQQYNHGRSNYVLLAGRTAGAGAGDGKHAHTCKLVQWQTQISPLAALLLCWASRQKLKVNHWAISTLILTFGSKLQLRDRKETRVKTMYVCSCMLSRLGQIQLFVPLGTVALQVPLSMGFSRQFYWNGLPCPPPGDSPNPGMGSASPASFFTHWDTWEAQNNVHTCVKENDETNCILISL